MNKINKKYLAIGGAALLLLIIVFVFARRLGKNENDKKGIDVTVQLKDQDGNLTTYNPNDLLKRLNKGLITRYYFDFSERCNPIKELYNLDAVRFVATVKAYKTKYNEDIKTHMKACYVDCNTGTGGGENYFNLVYAKIDSLKNIIN